jgi:hypothetical protein
MTSKVDPFWQKVIWTVLSAGLALLGAKLAPSLDVSQLLFVAGGTGIGGALIRQPGTRKHAHVPDAA